MVEAEIVYKRFKELLIDGHTKKEARKIIRRELKTSFPDSWNKKVRKELELK